MRLFIFLSIATMLAAPFAAAADGIVPVRLGQTVERTLDDAKKVSFAWRPKQSEGDARETRIFLPYGAPALLWQADNLTLSDPAPGRCAEVVTTDNQRPQALAYRLQFDKPISGFRCSAGYAELVLADGCVAGTEYSVDGKAWTTLQEHPAGTKSVTAPFCDPAKAAATGLDTRSLYLRLYVRQKADPAATGKEMYFKLRNSGDPSWGDAATTFFKDQVTVWAVRGK